VIPSLPPYRRSRVELDTRTLPRNVDIGNGARTIEAGRGSVNRVTFDVVRTRRVWLATTTEDGRPPPKGSSVTTEDGTFVTTVVGGGQIFLTDAVPLQTLIVRTSDDSTCKLTLELSDKADDDAFYERARAVCRS
jgi:outer membrane usher protein FimD/PapC